MPSLVGATFYLQMAVAEFDAAGNLAAVTSTNSLRATVGRF